MLNLRKIWEGYCTFNSAAKFMPRQSGGKTIINFSKKHLYSNFMPSFHCSTKYIGNYERIGGQWLFLTWIACFNNGRIHWEEVDSEIYKYLLFDAFSLNIF